MFLWLLWLGCGGANCERSTDVYAGLSQAEADDQVGWDTGMDRVEDLDCSTICSAGQPDDVDGVADGNCELVDPEGGDVVAANCEYLAGCLG